LAPGQGHERPHPGRAELREVIENRLGDGASDYRVERLGEAAWQEARQAGYRAGDDGTAFLAAVDWLERAGDGTAADIQARVDNAGKSGQPMPSLGGASRRPAAATRHGHPGRRPRKAALLVGELRVPA